MNPLALAGPEFLMFYIVACSVVLFLLSSWINSQEAQGTMPKLTFSDPYEIAMLRGGPNEALRVAVFSLIDRGLLTVTGEYLQSKGNAAVISANRVIEKEILKKFSAPGEASRVFANSELKACCDAYRVSLANLGLYSSNKQLENRFQLLSFGGAVIFGLAALKIYIAIQHGRSNFGFLLSLALIFGILLLKVYNRERTGLGDKMVGDLQTLFKGLKDRRAAIKPGGATNEAALLAAVFGLTALYEKGFPYVTKLFPKAPTSSSSSFFESCSSSCGSSCSSSSCSSSSSCGGSSCGGGGGGCGGCGS